MKLILLLYCVAILTNPFICSSTIMLLKNYRYVIFFNLEEQLKNILLIKYQNYLNNNNNTNNDKNYSISPKNKSKRFRIFSEDTK